MTAASTNPFSLQRGNAPVMVSIPHAGTTVPAEILARMTPAARQLADTDWHLPQVYDFLAAMDVTVLAATHSRLVVDLNRPPDNQNLYPGQNTTGLVPVDTFRFEPVYQDGPPDEAAIGERRELYWRPYHETLTAELARLRGQHERVVLWDAHSIASVLPRFFEGQLTDLNFGTAKGASCDPALIETILQPVAPGSDRTIAALAAAMSAGGAGLGGQVKKSARAAGPVARFYSARVKQHRKLLTLKRRAIFVDQIGERR